MNATAEAMAEKAKQNKSGVIIGVCIFLMSLAAVMVGLRLWCRQQRKTLGLDDVTIVIALACALGCGSSMLAMTHYGLGRHDFTLTQDEFRLYLRCFWISIMFYTFCLTATKLTFLIHYYRLMSVSNMRWVYIGAICFVSIFGTLQCIGSFLFCIPLEAYWDPRVKGRCFFNQTTLWTISGIIHIITDFAIIIMPLPIIWKLNLPLPQKLYLSGIFGLGFLTVAIAILRLPWLKPQADVTWWNVMAASWSIAELVSGITCACLPTFKPILAKIKTWFSPSSDGDSTIVLQGENPEGHTGSSKTAFAGHGGVGSAPIIPSSMYAYGTQTSISATQSDRNAPIFNMTIRLEKASEEHLPAISRIATSAFHPDTDALSRRLFPPHLQPKIVPDGEAAYEWRTARKASSLGSPDSHLIVAIDDEKELKDQIVGFSLWDAEPAAGSESGPNKEIQCAALDKEAFKQMKATVNQDAVETFGEKGIAGVWRVFSSHFVAFILLTWRLDLDYIGVSPGNQRRGIGKMLLEWGLGRAAEEGKDCYLIATEAGRPLYVAAGFKDLRVVSILGIPHYSMILRAGA
ncbi:hypothetical protein F53441_8024 [Fusarium austroafricanum]|uniref:N-acetyltransferase domain-containing protein n=1 Tax=Fusarium austroafricanum TaxID=2364996 RepID=A0A8H4NUV9_9HYPO|nr:hypothetical protein F53441_8024 [Fusarium austroafricanum]